MFSCKSRAAAWLLVLAVGVFSAGCGDKPRNEAEKKFLAAAKKGDAEAQYNLGASYEFGGGAPKDIDLARKWYEKAAAQGHKKAGARLRTLNPPPPPSKEEVAEIRKNAFKYNPDPEALYKWAECCEFGLGTEKDRDKALRFYNRAAARGNARAKERAKALAEELSPAAAEVKKFRDAARKGNAEGQYQFARCLEFGFHVKQNSDTARMWYRRAAAQGHPKAMALFNLKPKQSTRKPAKKRKK